MASLMATREPLYAQVYTFLAEQIATGVLPAGAQLPPENSLIEQFAVSRTTVRAAVQNLVQDGLVEIRRGKGTFVAKPAIVQELTELTGFVEDMVALGRRASARVLGKSPVYADETVARELKIKTGTLVLRVHRIRLADGAPIMTDESYLPWDLGEKILEEDLERDPIFSLLESKYKVQLAEAEYRLQATVADTFVAQALEIEVGSAVLLIERTSISVDRRPVDFERLYYRGDQIRFVTRLSRRTGRMS